MLIKSSCHMSVPQRIYVRFITCLHWRSQYGDMVMALS